VTWPTDFTAEDLLACFYTDTTYADLDAGEYLADYRWDNLISDAGWEVDGQVPANDGWRVYLADLTSTISWAVDGNRQQDTSTGTAHVAINDDGGVVFFPACT